MNLLKPISKYILAYIELNFFDFNNYVLAFPLTHTFVHCKKFHCKSCNVFFYYRNKKNIRPKKQYNFERGKIMTTFLFIIYFKT